MQKQKLTNNINITYLHSNAQDLHSWIAIDYQNIVVGHIFMQVEKDNKIKFLDAWVSENNRRQGIFKMLWETRWEFVLDNYKNYTVYAWCKDNSLQFVLSKGFVAGEKATYVERKVS